MAPPPPSWNFDSRSTRGLRCLCVKHAAREDPPVSHARRSDLACSARPRAARSLFPGSLSSSFPMCAAAGTRPTLTLTRHLHPHDRPSPSPEICTSESRADLRLRVRVRGRPCDPTGTSASGTCCAPCARYSRSRCAQASRSLFQFSSSPYTVPVCLGCEGPSIAEPCSVRVV